MDPGGALSWSDGLRHAVVAWAPGTSGLNTLDSVGDSMESTVEVPPDLLMESGPRDVIAVPDHFAATARFELRRRLGTGGFGIVYEAFDRALGATVALKRLQRNDPGAVRRLEREFRTLSEIDHPNLVQVHELFEDRAGWFFTMELVRGEDILSFVRGPAGGGPAGGVCDERRLRSALGQLAAGLSALHEQRKIHRDIKPSNVLVTAEGRVAILDFGLVVDVDEEQPVSVIGGTPRFMAPEQGQGEPLGPWTDWYAVGVILYAALSGRLPYSGSVSEVARARVEHDPLPPSGLAGVAPDLETLCMQLLRRDPATRAGAAEVARCLGGGGRSTPEPCGFS